MVVFCYGVAQAEWATALNVGEWRESAQKNFGDASLHPREFLSDFWRAYLFFFAFFFAAILFSSKLFEIHASVAGGARIQSHV